MKQIPGIDVVVVGGGLAGSEAAWQAADAGLRVCLYEMRPGVPTGAHVSGNLAELVCSNSLGSDLPNKASGLLKQELRMLDSRLLACALETAVPAGGALAVDREAFARRVTEHIESHPNIELLREEVKDIPDGLTILASGPLTSAPLSSALARLAGQEHLYFFDAIAPLVAADSIDLGIAFRASRYGQSDNEEGDYINCPLDKAEYALFVDAILAAERIALKDFELDLETGVRAGMHEFFEGCLPVEVIARRGRDSLAFGPLRPVGLVDPRTGKRPYAVVQLRQDNLAGTLYNIVGFQTNLTFSEQKKVLRLVPGLQNAEFERYGQMHRNTFIFSPALLQPTLQFRQRSDLFIAGQLTGVEGYAGNIATGVLAGLNAVRLARGLPLLEFPPTSMLGALCHYITHASARDFQPTKANFGLLPAVEEPAGIKRNRRMGRSERAGLASKRALADLSSYLTQQGIYPKGG